MGNPRTTPLSLGIRHLLRENRLSRGRLDQLRAHERWTPERLSAYRDRMLRRTLEAARRSLPAFAGLRIPADDGALVPFLQEACPVHFRTDLLSRREQLCPHGGRTRPWTIVGRTSGTTGTPIEVFRSYSSVLWEIAFLRRHWAWSGFRAGMRRATLRGEYVKDLEDRAPPYWVENRADHQLLLSTRHLDRRTAGHFVEALRRFRPYMLQAYPSTAFVLAQALEERDERLDLPWVCTGSEMLYPAQRELIERRIGRVMDFYGMAERVAFASECAHGGLHVHPDYSFVEILDEHGRPTEEEGFLAGTTFHNRLMPLVRYRLSDRTRWRRGDCPCGLPFPTIEPIQGKFEDMLYGSRGNPVSPSIVTFAFKGVSNIEASQVAQVGPARWEVRVVPGPSYTDHDGEHVVGNLHALVDPGLSVTVVLRESIERTVAGKYRWVVNEWGGADEPGER